MGLTLFSKIYNRLCKEGSISGQLNENFSLKHWNMHHHHDMFLIVWQVTVKTGIHWKLWVTMMPTLSSMLAPEVVITTTYGVTSDDKVGIVTVSGH